MGVVGQERTQKIQQAQGKHREGEEVDREGQTHWTKKRLAALWHLPGWARANCCHIVLIIKREWCAYRWTKVQVMRKVKMYIDTTCKKGFWKIKNREFTSRHAYPPARFALCWVSSPNIHTQNAEQGEGQGAGVAMHRIRWSSAGIFKAGRIGLLELAEIWRFYILPAFVVFCCCIRRHIVHLSVSCVGIK